MTERERPIEEDPGDVMRLACELMEEERGKLRAADFEKIGVEIDVPPEYVRRAIDLLQRQRVAQARRVTRRRLLAGAGAAVLVGASVVAGIVASRSPEAPTTPAAPVHALDGLVVAFDLAHGDGAHEGASSLEAMGVRVRFIEGESIALGALHDVDVLVILHARRRPYSENELDAVDRFVRDGGGLVASDLGWSWVVYDKQPLDALPLNALGARLGFRFTAENIGPPVRVESRALGGVERVAQTDWAASRIELTGDATRILIRDDELRPMAGTLAVGRGRVAVFGHPGMLRDNRGLFLWAVELAGGRGGPPVGVPRCVCGKSDGGQCTGGSCCACLAKTMSITLETRQWNGPAVSSTRQAISVWSALPTGIPGYGTASLASTASFSNRSALGGLNSNIAYHLTAVIEVAPGSAGAWGFRLGPDFGGGGTLLVDGVEVEAQWNDIFWSSSWNDPNMVIEGTRNLSAGSHTIEAYGFERCCDGAAAFEVMAPSGLGWAPLAN